MNQENSSFDAKSGTRDLSPRPGFGF